MKKECEALTSKLQDLSEDELELVTGGKVIRTGLTCACDAPSCSINPNTCTVKTSIGWCPKE